MAIIATIEKSPRHRISKNHLRISSLKDASYCKLNERWPSHQKVPQCHYWIYCRLIKHFKIIFCQFPSQRRVVFGPVIAFSLLYLEKRSEFMFLFHFENRVPVLFKFLYSVIPSCTLFHSTMISLVL